MMIIKGKLYIAPGMVLMNKTTGKPMTYDEYKKQSEVIK